MKQGSAKKAEMAMKRKNIVLIVLGLALLTSLLACGFFGVKALRHTRLRRKAMTAYENREYALAERLLRQYVQEDPDAEEEIVVLANLYRELGNAGMEAQMWQTAISLNPRNREYLENLLTSAVKSASYPLLHGILARMEKGNETFTDQELYLYVISSFRSGYPKDGVDAYRKVVKADPGAFGGNELGQMAEFMTLYESLRESERDSYLNRAMQSKDPVIRFEALYFAFRRLEQRGAEDAEFENLLKQLVETNYFAGTPILADFYYSKFRFGDVVDVAGPYLETVDDTDLYLLYAESCVLTGRLDELRALEKKLRGKMDSLRILADYCQILIAYLENDDVKLVIAARKAGRIIDSPLSSFIRLRVAVASESFSEIRTVAKEIFSSEPFYDLHIRALLVCLDCISREMRKPENRKDPSQIVDLAKILSMYLHGNRMLTDIILTDQCRKGLVNEADLMAALEQFPDDVLFQLIAAEYLILNGKAKQAMTILEPILAAAEEMNQETVSKVLFLHMLALDRLGRRDEAAAAFRELVEQSGFNLELLFEYFEFCVENDREDDLTAMADKLDALDDGKLEHFGKFFRAAAMLAAEDGAAEQEKEALDLLASTPADAPEFTFYAANRLCEHGRLDEAEEKYLAIRKNCRIPSLVYVNLSNIYHAKGEEQKALEAAKEAFGMEKTSMLPAFVYAKRLSEAERWQEAVDVLKFPRHAVNYREDVVALWIECMRHVIEKSISDRRFLLAEAQCRHLLMIAPDDEFGLETMERIREILNPKKDDAQNGEPGAAASGVPAA